MREDETVMSESEFSNFLELVKSAAQAGNGKFIPKFIRARVLEVSLGQSKAALREEMGSPGILVVFSQTSSGAPDLRWRIKRANRRSGPRWYIEDRSGGERYSLATLAKEVIWQLSSFAPG